jgi:hypothetical protein
LSEPQPCQEQDDWELLLKNIDQGNKGCGFEEFLYLLFCDGKIVNDESGDEKKNKEHFYLFAAQPGHKLSYDDFIKMNRLVSNDLTIFEEKMVAVKKAFAPNNTKLLTFEGEI